MMLFLDDERTPSDVSWITLFEGSYHIVRSYDEFVDYILGFGIPDVISFDNDLGTELEGKDCAKWLIDRFIDGSIEYKKFDFTVHSKNNIAAEWITGYINQYILFVEGKHASHIST